MFLAQVVERTLQKTKFVNRSVRRNRFTGLVLYICKIKRDEEFDVMKYNLRSCLAAHPGSRIIGSRKERERQAADSGKAMHLLPGSRTDFCLGNRFRSFT